MRCTNTQAPSWEVAGTRCLFFLSHYRSLTRRRIALALSTFSCRSFSHWALVHDRLEVFPWVVITPRSVESFLEQL